MRIADFLEPVTVAVYGASESPTSPAAHIFRNLLNQGFSGEVVAINPKYDTVAGRPCYPSQVAGGVAADLAVMAIPASAVPTALQDCGAVGTRAVIVNTAGFDDGTGPASQTRLMETAKDAGIRFIGPNCLGLVRPQTKLNATFQPAMPPSGGLALISQSGAICSGLADMAEAEGLGFSLMLSLGNSLNTGMGDALELAVEDPKTKVILAYVEGIRNGPKFLSALKQACAKKPVIVLKAGRHAEGAEAAATHTGALIGSDRVFSSVLKECGAVQVATLGELIETARLMSSMPKITGGRLAILTNGGGVGVLSADRLADRDLHPANLPPEVIERLDPVLSRNWSRRNPIDIVGDATPAHYGAALGALLESAAFDAVLTLLSPQSMTSPEAVADVVLEARSTSEKPLMTCFLGGLVGRLGALETAPSGDRRLRSSGTCRSGLCRSASGQTTVEPLSGAAAPQWAKKHGGRSLSGARGRDPGRPDRRRAFAQTTGRGRHPLPHSRTGGNAGRRRGCVRKAERTGSFEDLLFRYLAQVRSRWRSFEPANEGRGRSSVRRYRLPRAGDAARGRYTRRHG